MNKIVFVGALFALLLTAGGLMVSADISAEEDSVSPKAPVTQCGASCTADSPCAGACGGSCGVSSCGCR